MVTVSWSRSKFRVHRGRPLPCSGARSINCMSCRGLKINCNTCMQLFCADRESTAGDVGQVDTTCIQIHHRVPPRTNTLLGSPPAPRRATPSIDNPHLVHANIESLLKYMVTYIQNFPSGTTAMYFWYWRPSSIYHSPRCRRLSTLVLPC